MVTLFGADHVPETDALRGQSDRIESRRSIGAASCKGFGTRMEFLGSSRHAGCSSCPESWKMRWGAVGGNTCDPIQFPEPIGLGKGTGTGVAWLPVIAISNALCFAFVSSSGGCHFAVCAAATATLISRTNTLANAHTQRHFTAPRRPRSLQLGVPKAKRVYWKCSRAAAEHQSQTTLLQSWFQPRPEPKQKIQSNRMQGELTAAHALCIRSSRRTTHTYTATLRTCCRMRK